jgi:hypothetical protein
MLRNAFIKSLVPKLDEPATVEEVEAKEEKGRKPNSSPPSENAQNK